MADKRGTNERNEGGGEEKGFRKSEVRLDRYPD